MPTIEFNRYYRYPELTELLKAFETEYPHLVKLISIGKSHEGRDIWLIELTSAMSGPAKDKPAFWCDGNIHATEVSASTAVLYLLNKVCTKYGSDEEITRLMETRALYLVPRLSPDGAELALQDTPKMVRSGTKKYPYEEEDVYGLERMDIDGDGRVLNMRIQDPNGPWKIAEENPRLLKRREPGDSGGQYYRLMPEGLFHNFDGLTMRGRRTPEGLDFNRNFPNAWRQEQEQFGAGKFPTSEPEIRACVEAITSRPNICGAITFHTYSGVHLRPPSRHADDELPAEDLWTYKAFGKKGEELTGYPAISNFHEFKYHPKEVITGVFDDWIYEHQGVFAWTTEIWAPVRQAGITDYKYIDWFRDHPFEDDVKMLEWADKELDGKGYIDWFEFEHPQLGRVELGGWDAFYAFRNPPLKFLEKEIAPLGDWAIWQALASPKLELRVLEIQPKEGSWLVRFAVQNSGYLPTHVTEMAKKKNLVRGVFGEISKQGSDTGIAGSLKPSWLVSGELRQDKGQLAGWNHVSAGGFGYTLNGTDDVAIFEWVINEPGTYELLAKHDRAGVVRETFVI